MLLQALCKLLDFISFVMMWSGALMLTIIGSIQFAKTDDASLLVVGCVWLSSSIYVFKDDLDEKRTKQ